ncbi:MAG: LysR family transcriptional regulator [Rubrivivax sp.]|jgi:DNA-binding transcriptional LysR family regulator
MREVNFQNVDLNLLRVFDSVYRERHLTRAGQYLCLTQPAMSHALARLRTLFGDELFLRTSRGMEPTPGAEQIAGPISEAIGAVQRLLQGIARFDPLAAQMTFRIGVTDHTSAVVLPPLLERLREHAPGIDIQASHVNVESARELLDEGALHLAVVGSGDHPPRFDVRHLLREPLVCMGAHDHPGLVEPLTLQGFAALDHIVVSPSASHRSLIDQLLASKNLRRRTVLSIPFLTAVPQLVANSRLVCVVPRNLVDRLEPYGRFRWLPVPLEGAYFDFFAVWHSRETLTPSHDWLRSQVLGSAGAG